MRQTVTMHAFTHRLRTPDFRLFGVEWPAFQVCGCAGLVCAIALSLWLDARLGLSYLITMAILIVAIATFLTVAMVTKLLAGEEKLIYYHHEAAILVTTGILLRLMDRPVLPYLDVTILGIGSFLIFGRIGCLMTGCCHGAPSLRGVVYSESHASAGFPRYLVGVSLFPVQAVESLAVLGIVAAGSAIVLGGGPGSALAFYTMAYGVTRFGLEFLRGDIARRYFGGFSGAQWFSLSAMVAVAAAEWSGVLAFRWWHSVAAPGMIAIMAIAAWWRYITAAGRFRVLHSGHVREVADRLQSLTPAERQCEISVGRTSLGLRISEGRIDGAEGPIRHFAISSQRGDISRRNAARLARLILNLSRIGGSCELVDGNQGVFHLLIHPLNRGQKVGL